MRRSSRRAPLPSRGPRPSAPSNIQDWLHTAAPAVETRTSEPSEVYPSDSASVRGHIHKRRNQSYAEDWGPSKSSAPRQRRPSRPAFMREVDEPPSLKPPAEVYIRRQASRKPPNPKPAPARRVPPVAPLSTVDESAAPESISEEEEEEDWEDWEASDFSNHDEESAQNSASAAHDYAPSRPAHPGFHPGYWNPNQQPQHAHNPGVWRNNLVPFGYEGANFWPSMDEPAYPHHQPYTPYAGRGSGMPYPTSNAPQYPPRPPQPAPQTYAQSTMPYQGYNPYPQPPLLGQPPSQLPEFIPYQGVHPGQEYYQSKNPSNPYNSSGPYPYYMAPPPPPPPAPPTEAPAARTPPPPAANNAKLEMEERVAKHGIDMAAKVAMEFEIARARAEVEYSIKRQAEMKEEAEEDLKRRLEGERLIIEKRLREEFIAEMQGRRPDDKRPSRVRGEEVRYETDEKVQELRGEIVNLAQKLQYEMDLRKAAEEERDRLHGSTKHSSQQSEAGTPHERHIEEESHVIPDEDVEEVDMAPGFPPPVWKPTMSQSDQSSLPPEVPEPPIQEAVFENETGDDRITQSGSDFDSDSENESQDFQSESSRWRSYRRRQREQRDRKRRELRVVREELIDPILDAIQDRLDRHMFEGARLYMPPMYAPYSPYDSEDEGSRLSLDEGHVEDGKTIIPLHHGRMQRNDPIQGDHEVPSPTKNATEQLTPGLPRRLSLFSPEEENSNEDNGAKLDDGDTIALPATKETLRLTEKADTENMKNAEEEDEVTRVNSDFDQINRPAKDQRTSEVSKVIELDAKGKKDGPLHDVPNHLSAETEDAKTPKQARVSPSSSILSRNSAKLSVRGSRIPRYSPRVNHKIPESTEPKVPDQEEVQERGHHKSIGGRRELLLPYADQFGRPIVSRRVRVTGDGRRIQEDENGMLLGFMRKPVVAVPVYEPVFAAMPLPKGRRYKHERIERIID